MRIPSRLKSVVKLCASGNTRYAIAGVHLQRYAKGVCRIEVTDGFQLFICSWLDTASPGDDEPSPFAAIVPADLWKTALSSKDEWVVLEEPINLKLLRFDRGDCAIVGEYDADAKFPNTEGLIPKYKKTEGSLFGMSHRKLAAMSDVFTRAEGESANPTRIHVGDTHKGVLLCLDADGLEMTGVIMPCALEA